MGCFKSTFEKTMTDAHKLIDLIWSFGHLGLDPIGEFLIDCLEWAITFCNVVACRDSLGLIRSRNRFEIARIFGQTNWTWTLISLTEASNFVVIMLRQDWSHFEVSCSHSSTKLSCVCHRSLNWWCSAEPACIWVGLFVSLSNRHHSLLIGRGSKVDVGFGEFVSQTSWLFAVVISQSLRYEGLLCLRRVLACLAKVDWVNRFFLLLCHSNLTRSPLALSNLVIDLTLSLSWSLSSMAVSESKVASLDSFSLRCLLSCSITEQGISRGSLIHDGRAGLRGWLVIT